MGSFIVVLLIAVVIAAVMTGVLPNPVRPDRTEPVLVVASAADSDGAQIAVIAFTIEPGSGAVTLLDTLENVTISGTSAATPREALPFGGGSAVAKALAPQTGGHALEWILVPPEEWTPLVDEAGGVVVDVPEPINAYYRGKLTVLAPGSQRLGGSETAALGVSAPFVGDDLSRTSMLRELSAGLSSILAGNFGKMSELVEQGSVQSSLPAADLPVLNTTE